ncbi:MAG: ABC transporter substrate-binding protein [Pyrinomonadaceae bacterium]|nr:ABC transporter substrate-binding protein [Pyrinomonadaceae bacterium]
MRFIKLSFLLFVLIFSSAFASSCRTKSNNFVITLSEKFTIDPIGAPTIDAASERVRVLMFNSLVRKNEKFDYVPELATNIQRADDGLSYTFTLADNVKFHDGKVMTSADAKYTLETVLNSTTSGRTPSFYEGTGAARQGYITGLETPDPRTLIVRLRTPWLQLLPNLVPIAIIPQGSADAQKTKPIGTGPFKFVQWDSTQPYIDVIANPDYWQGAPSIQQIRVRAISDASALQAELRSGRVQLVPLPSNLSPDTLKSLGQVPDLKVEQFPGANVTYLGFNVKEAPLDNVKVRQAIAYAIDRESLIRDLLLGQAKIAHSILPEESWAYNAGQQYPYNPGAAKKLLDEAGFRDPDDDGPQMRFGKPISFKISSNSAATSQYAQVIQNYLKQVGIPVEIEPLESNLLREQAKRGQYQMTAANWVGGNQDPIFLKDLFMTKANFNRTNYSNPPLDPILQEAVDTVDREKARGLYAQAQETISRDVPMLPLWHPANMVIAQKKVGNIKVDGSGDWGFVRNLTVEK